VAVEQFVIYFYYHCVYQMYTALITLWSYQMRLYSTQKCTSCQSFQNN